MSDVVGVIPAAGRGTRAYPYTATIPKGLLEVDGRPLLVRNLERLRDHAGLTECLIVVGYRGEAIEERLGDGANLGVRLRYLRNDDLDLGLAHSFRLAGRALKGDPRDVLTVLSDEVYVGGDHGRMRHHDMGDAWGACGVVTTDLPAQIRRNYSVELADSSTLTAPRSARIQRIIEKPRTLPNRILGTGTYRLRPQVFDALEHAFEDGPPEWMTFLDALIHAGHRFDAVDLGGQYTNVNNRDELNRANLLLRNVDFDQRKVSVIVTFDGSRHAVPDVARRFAAAEDVDQIILVGRDAPREVRSLTELPGVELLDPGPGSFGDLVRAGLDTAAGDLLVVTQSDDSFVPEDLPKLLTYVRDADLVVGTRTTRQMIEQGSSMRGLVRLAHVVLAKLIELVWWRSAPRFTDAGCVYRVIWANTWRLVAPEVRAHGQEIYPEMVLEVMRAKRRVLEIPVHYANRDPEHVAVTSPHQTVATFLRIVRLVIGRRLRR